MTTSPLVRSFTSLANSLSMWTSSALDGITDWTRIFTSARAAEEAIIAVAARAPRALPTTKLV